MTFASGAFFWTWTAIDSETTSNWGGAKRRAPLIGRGAWGGAGGRMK